MCIDNAVPEATVLDDSDDPETPEYDGLNILLGKLRAPDAAGLNSANEE